MGAASSDVCKPPEIKSWPWKTGMFSTHDHQSLRRGFQVYRQVCAACHAMPQIMFIQFIDETHTEEELKALVKEEYIITDQQADENGKPWTRPGKLTDRMPLVYQNEQEARKANNGALPPNMEYIRNMRTDAMAGPNGEDYMFHLLTGYMDPPAGVTVGDGMHYNPYFKAGAIGMAPPLYNEIIQYEDGTPATLSQCASDVSQFLTFVSLPEKDRSNLAAFKIVPLCLFMIMASIYHKRVTFAGVKSTKTFWRDFKK